MTLYRYRADDGEETWRPFDEKPPACIELQEFGPIADLRDSSGDFHSASLKLGTRKRFYLVRETA